MYRAGHVGVALLAYTPLGVAMSLLGQEPVAVGGALVSVALATLPDADHQLPLVEHRGPTHSVPFALLVGAIVGSTAVVAVGPSLPLGTVTIGVVGFVVGTLAIVSHLLADAITPMGIRPFWPVSDRHYTLDLTPAANPVANYVLLAVGVGAVGLGAAVVSVFG